MPGAVLTHADVVDAFAADGEADDFPLGLVFTLDDHRGNPEIDINDQVCRVAQVRPAGSKQHVILSAVPLGVRAQW